jgi:hypothetical protein
VLAFARERHEHAGQLGTLTLALALAAAGPVVYALVARAGSRATSLRKP